MALGLQGCGGGGAGSNPTPPAAVTVPVTGFVSKAPVDGASCTLFGAGGQSLGTASSARGRITFGEIAAVSANAQDTYYVQCAGGQYQDEATGKAATLGSLTAPAMVNGSERLAVLTPLSQLAWDQAGGKVAQVEAAARNVARAFGLEGVDILRTQPTDLNVQTSGDDAAGRYGIVLAAIAQYAKDTDQGLVGSMNTLRGGLAGADRLDPAQAVAMSAAIERLGNASQNGNAAVRANVVASTAARIGAAIVDRTVDAGLRLPAALAVSISKGTVQLGSTEPQFVTANSTSPEVKVYTSSNPAVALVDAQGAITTLGEGTTTITVSQAASTRFAAASHSVTLTVTKLTAPAASFNGATSSKSVALGDASNFVASASFTCATESNYAPAVTYASSAPDVATVNAATGAVSTKATGLTTITASVPAVGTCAAQSVSYTLQVTPPATATVTNRVLTSMSTVADNLVSGGNAGTWTLRGTGLAGYVLDATVIGRVAGVLVDGVPCKAPGVVNAAGTEITGIDCTNVATNETASSIRLELTELRASVQGDLGIPRGAAVLYSGSIPMVPAPIPTLSATLTASAVKLGASSNPAPTVTAHSFSTGALAWSVDNDSFSANNVTGVFSDVRSRTFTMSESAQAGPTTVTIVQQAVPGMWARAVKQVVLTVSDRDVPVGTFEGARPDGTAAYTLGDPSVDVAASFACASNPAYNPVVRYELVDAPSDGPVTMDGKTLSFARAGSASVRAFVEQEGTCAAGEAFLTVNVAKATPTVSFSEPPTVVQVGATAAAGASVSALSSPAFTGTAIYTSSNQSAVTVSADGTITGVAAGKATISVQYTGDDNYEVPAIKSYDVEVRDAVVTVTGLDSGQTVEVKLSASETSSSASFANGTDLPFKAKSLTADADYTAEVTSEPATKVCQVTSATASGKVGNVATPIVVDCKDRFVKVSATGSDLPGTATSWCATKDLKTNRTWEAGDPALLPGGTVPGSYDQTGKPTNAVGHREKANSVVQCGFQDWGIPVNIVPSYLTIGTDSAEVNASVAALFAATVSSSDAAHWSLRDGDWWTIKAGTAPQMESSPASVTAVPRLVRVTDPALEPAAPPPTTPTMPTTPTNPSEPPTGTPHPCLSDPTLCAAGRR